VLLCSAGGTSEKNSGEEKEFMHIVGSLVLADPFSEIRSRFLAHNNRMIGFIAVNIHGQFYPFKCFISPDVLNIYDVLPVCPEESMIIKKSLQFRKILITHISFALFVKYVNNPAFRIKQYNVFDLSQHIGEPFLRQVFPSFVKEFLLFLTLLKMLFQVFIFVHHFDRSLSSIGFNKYSMPLCSKAFIINPSKAVTNTTVYRILFFQKW
jgi:hypothetical protein